MEIDLALIDAINRYLLVNTEIEPADLGFVFGTRHGVEEFCRETARLWHDGYFHHVLVTGGVTLDESQSEANILRSKLVERGVPGERILMEERATDTGENVLFSIPVIERELGLENVKSVLAIGKFRTSRRYLMTLQKHWPDVRKMLVPIHYHDVDRTRWHEDGELRDQVMAEWARIVPYFRRGFIEEVDLPGIEYRPELDP